MANTSSPDGTCYSWRAHSPSDVDAATWAIAGLPESNLSMAKQWEIGNEPIKYCLSERVPGKCQLQSSVTIMVVVIFCNFVKVICALSILLQQQSSTLVTFGDAVSFFLDNADYTTLGRCTMSRGDVIEGMWDNGRKRGESVPQPVSPDAWKLHRQNHGHLWFTAASVRRWLFCNML